MKSWKTRRFSLPDEFPPFVFDTLGVFLSRVIREKLSRKLNARNTPRERSMLMGALVRKKNRRIKLN